MAVSPKVAIAEKFRKQPKPTWDLVFRRNYVERLKHEKHPMDILQELPDMIRKGYEAIPEEDIVRLNWWGLTHDKPKVGTFMVRIKVPGGQITPAQFRAIGEIAVRYGRNYAELTTRQGVQLHWVRLDQLPDVLAAIEAAGLTTAGGEGDTVRNITSCPVAGISREELFDVTPVIREAARFFYGNRDYSNLPRKHKYTITACPYQCSAPEIHDVALIGVIKDGRAGFAVRVGGGLSSTPRLSRDLGVFVPVEEAIEVLRAITDTWQNDLRYRLSRARARIKFMIDDYGVERFREMVEERLGRRLEDGHAPEPIGDNAHLGIHPQKQEGYYYVGFPVPMGWITGEQMQRVADIVERVGGDIRLTRLQNFIVGNVPEDHLEAFLQEMARAGFPHDRFPLYGTSIACTSHKFCNYSVAETKEKLQEIVETLQARFGDAVAHLRIFMDGCPHACAHHWVGDIGLQGTTTTGPNREKIEAYDVTLRGGLGPRAAIGKPLLRRVPHDRIIDVLVRLIDAWLAERNGREDYTFRDFCEAHTDAELQAIALGQVQEEKEVTGVVLRIPGPILHLTNGVELIEVEAGTVREALLAAGKIYPALRDHVLTADGKVNPTLMIYVRDEPIDAFDGLDTRVRPGEEIVILPAISGGSDAAAQALTEAAAEEDLPSGPRVTFDDLEIGEIAMLLDYSEPEDVIAWALETFGDRVAVVTALQAEGLVILDMAYRMKPDIRVVTVDTGRLPQETYEFMDRVREHYPEAKFQVLFPDYRQVEKMVRRHGVNLFYKSVDLRFLCCHVRKVLPLVRYLRHLDAWFTGLRREQWASRANIRKVELDHDHGGIVKISPLADWTKEEVWEYIRTHNVPYHPLYDQGYTSIGCAPCTRPIQPGEDDRAGRWWWEVNAPKECGIHCPIETGGFEHELEAILGKNGHDTQP